MHESCHRSCRTSTYDAGDGQQFEGRQTDISHGRHHVQQTDLTIFATVGQRKQIDRGDATMHSRYVVVDVKGVVAFSSVHSLTVVTVVP